ncbi:hypothetical protein GL213_12790 [Halogeometricum borinquense]|uniref:Transcriptional regulator n=1 Tax=Halogeometricum borinquense TaxID=60847 RepID=A0A6C0UJZ4_9EURY|nr:hypothetical protein [Halogeometricum borinquense]QIB73278.1 hypothetical protein G3I44_02650 [Halogeometricum borinquense]QIQ77327.1 hypothetical protein GL213_12790 [Halogeometricum borinquense]
MSEETEPDTEDVQVSMEITGSYDDVLSRLSPVEKRRDGINSLIQDVEIVLETLERMGEGTRSAIAKNLPGDTTAELDAEAVVELLHVLKRYDLVVLEGNTWKPRQRDE